MSIEDTHPVQDTVERVRQQLRAGRQLEQAMLPCNMLVILWVVLAQVLNTVLELGDARRYMMVTVEADGAVCNRLRPN